MKSDIIGLLKQIYGATKTPVAVTDEKLDIMWKNSAADELTFFNGDSLGFVADGGEVPDGMVSLCIDGMYHLFNVIRYSDEECFYIIEYSGTDFSHDVSYMSSYFRFLCSRLRESASQIVMSIDDIDKIVKSGGTDTASALNRIDRNVMLLLREAIVPEQLFCSIDSHYKDEVICIEENVAKSAAEAERIIGRGTDIWQNDESGIYAAINKSVFETVLACMTAGCCCGELFPERVEYRVSRDAENIERASVSVRSINLSGKKNSVMPLEALKTNDFFTDADFRGILSKKYGAVFEHIFHNDGIESRMTLNVLPESSYIIRTDLKETLDVTRFSAMAIALSEKHYSGCYNNIKIE